MLPGEVIILMAIVESGEIARKLVNSPMDVTGEYIGYLYNSLVKRGFLTGDSSTGYQLTAKGRDSLCEFLRENSNTARNVLGSLQQLCIGISSQEIEEIEKKPIEVK